MGGEGRWQWREAPTPAPRPLIEAAARHGIAAAPLVAGLLRSRGVHEPEAVGRFLRPTLAEGLRSPLLMPAMERAAERLAAAVAGREGIAVYGDYDVDGITGTAAVVGCLQELGVRPLVHVAHRMREGYGLQADVLRRLRREGASVVVTVDCGTGNPAELQVARDVGLDVIVCDHHQVPVEPSPAFALLNPHRADCAFPFKGLSGVGVAFYLLMGLRAALRSRGWSPLPDLRQHLDLVALGTVADLVPLRAENRVLVARGLAEIDRARRPGLRALKEVALVEHATVRAIAHRLAPRLNAGGRLADARVAVDLLTTADDAEARRLAAEIELHNAERRAIEEAVTAAAMEAAAGCGDGVIVVAGQGWHPGVVGIVAARLVEAFARPAVVIALEGDEGRGSGRSVAGVDLYAAMSGCRSAVEQFGGHRGAVGFRVARARIDDLREMLGRWVGAQAAMLPRRPPMAIDAELTLAGITTPLVRELALLEPHGVDNPPPALLARGVRVESARSVGDPARPHLRCRLRQDGRTVAAIGFDMGAADVRPGALLDIVFTPRLGRWQGLERIEIELLAFRPGEGAEGAQVPDVAGDLSIP